MLKIATSLSTIYSTYLPFSGFFDVSSSGLTLGSPTAKADYRVKRDNGDSL